jgi:hypothetical protein
MIRVREYGTRGPPVIVLQGGPGAPGPMALVAEDFFRVLGRWLLATFMKREGANGVAIR